MSDAPWWLWCLVGLAAGLHLAGDLLRARNREALRRMTWLD